MKHRFDDSSNHNQTCMRLPGCCMASVSKPYRQILKVSWLLRVTTQNSSHLQFISCSISRKDFLWEAMDRTMMTMMTMKFIIYWLFIKTKLKSLRSQASTLLLTASKSFMLKRFLGPVHPSGGLARLTIKLFINLLVVITSSIAPSLVVLNPINPWDFSSEDPNTTQYRRLILFPCRSWLKEMHWASLNFFSSQSWTASFKHQSIFFSLFLEGASLKASALERLASASRNSSWVGQVFFSLFTLIWLMGTFRIAAWCLSVSECSRSREGLVLDGHHLS